MSPPPGSLPAAQIDRLLTPPGLPLPSMVSLPTLPSSRRAESVCGVLSQLSLPSPFDGWGWGNRCRKGGFQEQGADLTSRPRVSRRCLALLGATRPTLDPWRGAGSASSVLPAPQHRSRAGAQLACSLGPWPRLRGFGPWLSWEHALQPDSPEDGLLMKT